jgi:hypothetical protein
MMARYVEAFKMKWNLPLAGSTGGPIMPPGTYCLQCDSGGTACSFTSDA